MNNNLLAHFPPFHYGVAAILPIFNIWGYKPCIAFNRSLGCEVSFLASLFISPQRRLQPGICKAHITSRMTRMQVISTNCIVLNIFWEEHDGR